jgi:hypothetical protein
LTDHFDTDSRARHRRRLGTAWLAAPVLIVSTISPSAPGTLPTNTKASNPLITYASPSASASGWTTSNLTSALSGVNILGTPDVASANGVAYVVARLSNGDVALIQRGPGSYATLTDLTTSDGAPSASADPVVILDQFGRANVVYDSRGRLELVTPRWALYSRGAHFAPSPPSYYVSTLNKGSGLPAYTGAPGISVAGSTGVVAYRSTSSHVVVVQLRWNSAQNPATFSRALDLTRNTRGSAAVGEPVVIPNQPNLVSVTDSNHHVELLLHQGSGWHNTDISALLGAPGLTGSLSAMIQGTAVHLVGLTSAGHVILLSAPSAYSPPNAWTLDDVTAQVNGPTLQGGLFSDDSTGTAVIAGAGNDQHDLWTYTLAPGATSWSVTDVSRQSGNVSPLVHSGVSGGWVDGNLILLDAGRGFAARGGVGVYAIPNADFSRAISDGWPILGETGGLGTLSAPWVQSQPPATVETPNFLVGQAIAQSNRNETWLSFWTVSGPLTPQTTNAAAFYAHGYAAGQYVAQQIDQYSSHGLGLKPNWVILDPEGYPDAHSGLDAPAGSAPSVLGTYQGYWSAMLSGWSKGLTSIDPRLTPAVYSSQSEYRTYGLGSSGLPTFMAVAFGGGGPVRLPGTYGSNVLGFIAFNATCVPLATLRAEEQTLASPPWSGIYNTLQFNPGVYCAP